MPIKLCGPFSKIDIKKYDINSSAQLKEYLFSIGWKPTSWNYKKMPDGSLQKMSPKITLDSLDFLDSEFGRLLKKRNILTHRRSLILNPEDDTKGILGKMREDGRVSADAMTCGTPTARYTHISPVANIPKAKEGILYGKEIRSMYCCLPPYKMVGSDLSGIEARLLGHFAWPYDEGQLAFDLLQGDIHTKTAEALGCDRNTAKTFRYAAMYGAGIMKLASILNCSKKEAESKYADFLDTSPGMKGLILDLEKAYIKKRWIRGIDGRKIHIRGKHVLLNCLIQGTAAVLFKDWGCRIWDAIDKYGYDAEIIISYHDEFELRVHERCVKDIATQLSLTLYDTERHFNIRVPLVTDTKVGMNWADVH